MSFGLVLLAGLAVQLFSGRLGLKSLTWKQFAAGLGVFLLTMLPYAVWYASSALAKPIGQPELPFTGSDAAQLGGIISYEVKARSGLPLRALLVRFITLLPLEALVPLLALYLPKVRPAQALGSREGGGFASACVKVLAVVSVFTVFPYAMSLALSPTRYALIPRLSLDFLACAALAARRGRFRAEVLYPAVILGLLVFTLAWRVFLLPGVSPLPGLGETLFAAAAGAALARLSRRGGASCGARALFGTALFMPLLLAAAIRADKADPSHDNIPGSADFEAMSRAVISRTGWTYADARLRIFYVNIRDTVTPSWIYRAVQAEKTAPDRGGSGLDRVDGYFAALSRGDRPLPGGAGEAGRWLLAQDIPEMLKDAISSGGILLGTPAGSGRLSLVPYKVTDTQRLPPYFHNSSEGYSLTGPAAAFAPAPGARTFRFTFNDCPDHDKACDIKADVQLRQAGGGRLFARVRFSGEPLSQVCDGVNMRWNQRLEKPYFSVSCGGGRQRVRLAATLGMDRDRARDMNRALLAPYERDFSVVCRGGIRSVSIGYEAASAYSRAREIDGLPGRELSKKGDADAPPER
jgi:hypothetical protein